eukprot:scaffold7335_cov417-Prasinococcus_capsulatus_cf.AAC.9
MHPNLARGWPMSAGGPACDGSQLARTAASCSVAWQALAVVTAARVTCVPGHPPHAATGLLVNGLN